MDFSTSFDSLRHWTFALAVLGGSIVVAQFTRALFKQIHKKRHKKWAHLLGPGVANLFYVVGVELFLDFAPIHSKVLYWLEASAYVAGVLILLSIARRSAFMSIEWSTQRSQYSKDLTQGFVPLLKNVLTLLLLFTASIMILKRFNYDVLSLLTALGVGSLAVGLAAKDTLANMISGFTLILDRNFTHGDRINLGGLIGDVEEIGLRSTRLRTSDGNMVIVPNTELVNTKILNFSLPSREIVCGFELRIPLEIEFEKVRELVGKVLSNLAIGGKIHASKNHSIHLKSIHQGFQEIKVSFWVDEMDDASAATSEAIDQVLRAMRNAQIPLLKPLSTT